MPCRMLEIFGAEQYKNTCKAVFAAWAPPVVVLDQCIVSFGALTIVFNIRRGSCGCCFVPCGSCGDPGATEGGLFAPRACESAGVGIRLFAEAEVPGRQACVSLSGVAQGATGCGRRAVAPSATVAIASHMAHDGKDATGGPAWPLGAPGGPPVPVPVPVAVAVARHSVPLHCTWREQGKRSDIGPRAAGASAGSSGRL